MQEAGITLMRRLYRSIHLIISFLLAAAIAACGGTETSDHPDVDAATANDCSDPALREAVEGFGRALQQVSLLAPDRLLEASLREHYAAFVTPALLQQWTSDPALAPGRLTSSPWPDRIEIESITREAETCVVRGSVVYATSADTAMNVDGAGSDALREDVALRLVHDDGWRISAFQRDDDGSRADAGDAANADGGHDGDAGAAAGTRDEEALSGTTPEHAADIIRRYYSAIAARDFVAAYRLWSDDGAASGQSLDEFRRGYARTARVQADVGTPMDVEGAAGSVYVKVPVVVRAVTESGEAQHFAGTYTLRRSIVDGASREQRAWRIYDAAIFATPADSAAAGM